MARIHLRPHPRRHFPSFTAVVAATACAAAVVLAAAGPASAATPEQFAAAFANLQQALNGDSGAIEPAAARWRALSEAEPGDPVLRAYAGSSTAMLARTTMLPWRKMSHVEDGLALLDKALAQLTPAHDAPAYQGVPASLATRYTAASTFLALPSMFNRNERGERLLADVAQSPLLAAAPADFRGAVWLAAAAHALDQKRPQEARQWLTKASQEGGKAAPEAARRLKEL